MKQILMDINVGIGDHLLLRMFVDGVKDQYDRIAITHSRPGMQFWHNNNAERWNFNLQLGKLVFGKAPYVLIPNANFPFYPNERIVREVNNKPVKPDLDCLCVGTPLGIGEYLVVNTKVRHIMKNDFEQAKDKLTLTLQRLAEKYTIVILGEREVQRTREYEADVNKNRVYGLYDYFIEIFPHDKILDLSIPALGFVCSDLPHLQQDCLIMKEAKAVINFGVGGNLWLASCVSKRTIDWHNDADPIMDMVRMVPDLQVTRDLDQFIDYLASL